MANEATSIISADEPVVFDEKQQAKVNELIQRAQGKAAKDLRDEIAAQTVQLTELQSQLTAAKALAAKAVTKAGKEDAASDVAALQAQIAEMKDASKTTNEAVARWKTEAETKAKEVLDAKSETLNVRKDVAITNAASRVNFVNTEVVLKLTKDLVKFDSESGRFTVLNDSGQTRLNAAMEPMSLDEFYNDFAAKNKYLVRGDIAAGSGSSEAAGRTNLSKNGKHEVKDIFGPKSNSKLANDLMKADPAEYRRMKAIAKDSGLISY